MNEEGEHQAEVGDLQGIPLIRAVPSFDRFYSSEFEAVAALAYVLSGSRIASEDIAQEAFLAAYRRWDEIGRYDNPGAWVRRVTANKSVSTIRRRVSEAKAITRIGDRGEPLPEMTTDSIDIWRAVRRLPTRQAQTIALFYLEDLPIEEIAEILDQSVNTVRTHLKRARHTLSRRLKVKEDLK